ncbi:MAG: anti-sigma factor family protein [Flavisolibacter sp.]
MSSNSNDNNPVIHPGNYEEFFILYLDDELTGPEKQLVEAFLEGHPHLQAEFEMLMATKLEPPVFSMDKKELMAESMKTSLLGEELFFYIDGELAGAEKQQVERELAADPSYRQQYELLLLTKLDPTETIACPNREALYHREHRVVSLRTWIRVAAAMLVLAVGGGLYFSNHHGVANPASLATVHRHTIENKKILAHQEAVLPAAPKPVTGETASSEETKNLAKTSPRENAGREVARTAERHPIVAKETPNHQQETDPLPAVETLRPATTAIALNTDLETPEAGFRPHEKIINHSPVTSALSQRTTISTAANPVPDKAVAGNNENKGSWKSFLRKATRVIERKTGVDPTDGDNELLIGAVAVKLK